jgi:anti-anti-sigma factor
MAQLCPNNSECMVLLERVFALAAWLQSLVAPSSFGETKVRTSDMRIDTPTAIFESDDFGFTVRVSKHGRHRIVEIRGELDISSRNTVRLACLEGRSKVVVVDLAHTTFMDCCGYGGLVAARRILQARGGSLTLKHQTGQPAEFLDLLALLEAGN